MKNRLLAMSLEELLTALAVIGILTMIILDSWRMVNVIRNRVAADIGRSGAVYDTLYRSRSYVQDDLEKERKDSLIIAQKRNEKTIE